MRFPLDFACLSLTDFSRRRSLDEKMKGQEEKRRRRKIERREKKSVSNPWNGTTNESHESQTFLLFSSDREFSTS